MQNIKKQNLIAVHTGLEITVGRWTLNDSEPILSNGNSLPLDTITDSELKEKDKIKIIFLLLFHYVKNLKCFIFTEHLKEAMFHTRK